MKLASWLRYLTSQFRASPASIYKGRRRRRYQRPRLAGEQLETRALLAVVSWDGGGGDFNWNNSLNWSADELPGPADDVTIDFGANDFSVVHSFGNTSVNSLTNRAALEVSGGSLLLNAASTIDGDLTLSFSATLGGTADIEVAGLFTWNPVSWSTATLQGVNGQGSLTANGGTNILGTTFVQDGFRFVNPVGQTVSWPSGPMQLLTGGTFINNGYMDIQDSRIDSNGVESYFENNGTLTKSAGGQTLFITPVHNSGTIAVQVGSLDLGWNGFDITNTGSILGAADTAIVLAGATTSSGVIEGDFVKFGGVMSGSFSASQSYISGTFTGNILNLGSLTVVNADLTDATFAPGVTNLSSLNILGTFQIDEPLTVSGQMTLDGGTLVTGSAVEVAGMLTWNSVPWGTSTLQGVNGQGTLTANGGTTISGTAFVQDEFRFINPVGQAVAWTSGSIQLRTGGAFINDGFMEIQADNLVDTNSFESYFENNGTLVKSAGAGTSAFQTPVHNSGMIDVQAGTLSMGWYATFEVTNTGTIHGAAGTAISLSASVTSSGIIEGDRVVFGGGVMSGSFSANESHIGGTFTGSVLKFGSLAAGNTDLTNATLAPGATNLSSLTVIGTLQIDEPFTVSGAMNVIGGTLITSSHVDALGLLTWNNGTLQGVNGQGSLSAHAEVTISGISIVNDIVVNVLAGATLEFNGDVGLSHTSGDKAILNNAGTIRKSGTSGGYSYISAILNNSGRVEVSDGGWLYLDPDGTSTGSFDVEAGSFLELAHTELAPESVVSNAGTLRLNTTDVHGTVSINGPGFLELLDADLGPESLIVGDGLISVRATQVRGTFNVTGTTTFYGGLSTFHPSSTVLNMGSGVTSSAHIDFSSGEPVNLASLTMLGGGLHGSDTLNVTGLTTFVGGEHSGTGVTNAFGGLRLEVGSYHYIKDRTLNIWGESSILPETPGNGIFYDKGVINIQEGATVDVPGDVFFIGWSHVAEQLVINNAGVLRKTAGVGSEWYSEFNNNGLLDIQTGELWLRGGGTSAGAFIVDSDARLNAFSIHTTPESQMDVAGSIALNFSVIRGTFNVTGTTYTNASAISGTIIDFGDLTAEGGLDLTHATFTAGGNVLDSLTLLGTLTTDGNLTVSGPFQWPYGTLQGGAGQGSLTVLSDMSLDGTAVIREIRNFTLINDANMTWSGGAVQFFGTTGGFVNSNGATFTNSFDGTFGSVDGNCLQFVNNGQFIKSGDADTTNLQMQLYNRGTVEVQQGQLYLGCGYVSNDPGNPPAPGIDYPPDHPPQYQNDDPVIIDSGSEPVIVPGSYTQTVNGLLIEQIAGHSGIGPYGTPGTDYGQLVVMGDLALNGTFDVQVIGGFIPTIGQQYLVIDNRGTEPIDGTFSGLPEGSIVWAGNYGFKVTYIGGEDDNDFVLTMDQVANGPPHADAGGPYEVAEGGSVTLTASASSDVQQATATLIFAWDLDGDGIFGEFGAAAGRGDENRMEPLFSAAGLDGPSSYPVSVRVTDEFGESDVAAVTISVLNVAPSTPVDIDVAPNEILENALTGTVGLTAFATDAGTVDVVTYRLTDDAGGRFAIDPGTGVVTVANGTLLDYEVATSHTIVVEASDGQGGTSTQSFTINLLNVTATISGTVFVDVDGDGSFDGGTESAIDAVMIELYDSSGTLLDTDLTALGGVYAFTVDDEQATYNLREIQPTGVDNGAAILGSAGGSVISPNEMQLTLTGSNASDYDFTESGQVVRAGDTASIGFWQNKNGQALIQQGGAALVSWLNTNFGNVFGDMFSNGIGGDNAMEVASFYKTEFFNLKLKGTPKVDAQFMATALAVFFTSSNLSGGSAAASYGFNVTQTGLGTTSVNIGSSGTAFGVANNTNMTIMSLLLATNHLTGGHTSGYSNVYDTNGDGVLTNYEKALRVLANTIYSAINEEGHF